jgi:SAM-dependent methyltransferase
MGEWKPGEYYDDGHWMGERKYAPRWPANYATIRFAKQAQEILKVSPLADVLDLGSGNGMFAAMLWHLGHRGRYMGADFSPGVTRDAIEGNRDLGGHRHAEFRLVDLDTVNVPPLLAWHGLDADGCSDLVVTSGECLEHMKNDRRLIATVPEGVPCVLSLPCFDDPSHLRWWPTVEDLEAYWRPFFTIESWRVQWIEYKHRSPESLCHLFSGVRNAFGHDVVWPPTVGGPPREAP